MRVELELNDPVVAHKFLKHVAAHMAFEHEDAHFESVYLELISGIKKYTEFVGISYDVFDDVGYISSDTVNPLIEEAERFAKSRNLVGVVKLKDIRKLAQNDGVKHKDWPHLVPNRCKHCGLRIEHVSVFDLVGYIHPDGFLSCPSGTTHAEPEE